MNKTDTFDADFRKKHTVCDAMLWDYLQGKLDTAEALLVSTHYHLSPEARKRINELNACAAVSLETLEPVAMKCSAQEILKKCCAHKVQKQEECQDKKASLPVPKPLQSYLGECFEGVQWKSVVPGIAEKRITICGSASIAKVMKIDKGAQVPTHSHPGAEITLIIHGAFEDKGEIFKAGEINYQAKNNQEGHAPQALEDCICLIVTSGGLRLPGILGMLINPILRLRLS